MIEPQQKAQEPDLPAGAPAEEATASEEPGTADRAAKPAAAKDQPTPEQPDPQQSATDPEQAREFAAYGRALTEALASLLGGLRGANIFLGATTVGTMVAGEHYAPSAGAAFDRLVPSGPISRTTLDQVTQTFVPPGSYDDVRQLLQSRAVVLLRASSGWGRTTAALHLLNEECAAGVHKLNPGTQLRSMDTTKFVTNSGYLLESLELDQARMLRAFDMEQLTARLNKQSCRLIVLLDRAALVHENEVGAYLADGGIGAPATEVVRRHFGWHLRSVTQRPDGTDGELLARVDVQELLDEVTAANMPARELAQFAAQLAQVALGRAELAQVRERYSAAAAAKFGEWFNDQGDIDQQAFVIALAVFNGLPLHVVSRAARLLATRIQAVQTPDPRDRTRSVFGTARRQRIEGAHAELVSAVESADYGPTAVQAVRYRDDRYPRLVLEHIWHQYDEAYDLVREWLLQLGDDPDPRVGTHAGVAVGLLSVFEFDSARRLVIEPWADSGTTRERQAAVGALQFPSMQPEFAPLISRMLGRWLRRDQPLARRVTAATALGSVGMLMPDRALRLLRMGADTDSVVLADAVGKAITELALQPDLIGKVLAALVRWTDHSRPLIRATSLLCVLRLGYYLEVTTSEGAENWPALVWLAEVDPASREPIITLLGRLLDAPFYLNSGYQRLRAWVDTAQKDASFREPLGEFMFDLGRATGDEKSLRFYLNTWSDERNGPVAAVADLLDVLDRKGNRL